MSGISRESERMSVLVDDLLLLARLDEGRPLALEPVSLGGADPLVVVLVPEPVAACPVMAVSVPVPVAIVAEVEVW